MQTETEIQSERITARMAEAKAAYPGMWRKITREWRAEARLDRAWLTYSANYLLHTAGVKWGLDPFSLSTRVTGVPVPDFYHDLQGLDLIVLTHAHSDHFDTNLLRALRNMPIPWVIPSFLFIKVQNEINISAERIFIPEAGKPLHFGGLTLTPFNALHLHGNQGVPETGYLAEFNGKRWLFPGDTRNYNPALVPAFQNLDGVFAHVWLGKAQALEFPPPLLGEFSSFHLAWKPDRIILTHLEEFGRTVEEVWDSRHCELIERELKARAPSVRVERALMGNCVGL